MNRTATTIIVLHHTVHRQPTSPSDKPQMDSQERAMQLIKNGHGGKSPYHIVIGHNWKYVDPFQAEVKFHAGNYPVNLVSVGVSLTSNFLTDVPTAYQKAELKKVLTGWMQQYGIKRGNIKLHREVRLEPTACPGRLDQSFITTLLAPTMPTCDQLLADEKRQHAETVERERDNYNNWQTQLDRANGLQVALTQERASHAETVKRADDNYKNWQDALDALGPLKQKIQNAKDALA